MENRDVAYAQTLIHVAKEIETASKSIALCANHAFTKDGFDYESRKRLEFLELEIEAMNKQVALLNKTYAMWLGERALRNS